MAAAAAAPATSGGRWSLWRCCSPLCRRHLRAALWSAASAAGHAASWAVARTVSGQYIQYYKTRILPSHVISIFIRTRTKGLEWVPFVLCTFYLFFKVLRTKSALYSIHNISILLIVRTYSTLMFPPTPQVFLSHNRYTGTSLNFFRKQRGDLIAGNVLCKVPMLSNFLSDLFVEQVWTDVWKP